MGGSDGFRSASDDLSARYDAALRHFNEERFDEAAEGFSRLVDDAPYDFRHWEMLAVSLCNAGRHADALDSFEKAEALGHTCVTCRYNRATALRILKRPADALAALERVFELEPDHLSAWYDRAMLLLGFHRAEPYEPLTVETGVGLVAACAALDRVLAREPASFAPWYYKALACLKVCSSSQVHHGWIVAGGRKDVPQEGLRCIAKARELAPPQPEVLDDVKGLEESLTELLPG